MLQENESAPLAGGADSVGVNRHGGWNWITFPGVLFGLQVVCGRGPFQSDEEPELLGGGTFGVMPEAEVADFMEPPGQDVLQESAHELLAGESAGPPAPLLAVLVAEADGLSVHGQDAAVGDGDTEGVAGQVVEDGPFAVSPHDAVDHPLLPPCRLWPDDVWTGGFESGHGLAPDEAGQCLGRDQEPLFGWMPDGTAVGDAASGDQTVDMGMEDELLGPGVQDHEDADRATDMSWIAGEFGEGLGGGLHEDGVTVVLIGPEDFSQGFRYGGGEVEIRDGQHLLPAFFQPDSGLAGVALGTVPVFAGVVGIDCGVAGIAAEEIAAEGHGSAVDDVVDGALVGGGHGVPIGIHVPLPKAAKNIREFGHDRPSGSEFGHDGVEGGAQLFSAWLGQMGVDSGGLNAGMAHEDLDDAHVHIVFRKPGGITVPKGMGRDVGG